MELTACEQSTMATTLHPNGYVESSRELTIGYEFKALTLPHEAKVRSTIERRWSYYGPFNLFLRRISYRPQPLAHFGINGDSGTIFLLLVSPGCRGDDPSPLPGLILTIKEEGPGTRLA